MTLLSRFDLTRGGIVDVAVGDHRRAAAPEIDVSQWRSGRECALIEIAVRPVLVDSKSEKVDR